MTDIIKVGFKMMDGTKFVGSLIHDEYKCIDDIIYSIRDGAPVPVHDVTVSGKTKSTVFVNRDHVSLWWEV